MIRIVTQFICSLVSLSNQNNLLHLQVAKRRPNDEDAKIKFTECNKMVKKQAFERAIANDVPDKTLAEIHTEFESIG